MSQEIERKFKVKNTNYKSLATKSYEVTQSYLSQDPKRTVRVRIADSKGYITIKGKGNKSGVSRYEFEKEIPVQEAKELIDLCDNSIIKNRYEIPNGDLIFEVDEFILPDKLTIAEIELPTESHEFEKPNWLGKEVTGKKKYYNSRISKGNFKTRLLKWLNKRINKIIFIGIPLVVFILIFSYRITSIFEHSYIITTIWCLMGLIYFNASVLFWSMWKNKNWGI